MKMQYLSLVLLLSLGGSMVAMDAGDATGGDASGTTSTTAADTTTPAADSTDSLLSQLTACPSAIFSDLKDDLLGLPSDLLGVFHPHCFIKNVWGHRKAIAGTLLVVYIVNHFDELKAQLGFGSNADEEEAE